MDGHVGDFRPALGRHHPVARIHCDDDAVLPFLCHVLDELRVFQGRRSDHQSRYAKREPALDIGGFANASAQLDMAGKRLDDPLHRRAIAALAREGSVEIDDMEMLGACLREQ